jgi:hypothetical protein
MKTSLRFTIPALAIVCPAAVFGGLIGIIPASALVGALFLYATAGLLLIALNDNGIARRPIIVHRTPALVCTAAAVEPARTRSSYGIRRQRCPVA